MLTAQHGKAWHSMAQHGTQHDDELGCGVESTAMVVLHCVTLNLPGANGIAGTVLADIQGCVFAAKQGIVMGMQWP